MATVEEREYKPFIHICAIVAGNARVFSVIHIGRARIVVLDWIIHKISLNEIILQFNLISEQIHAIIVSKNTYLNEGND